MNDTEQYQREVRFLLISKYVRASAFAASAINN